MSRRRMAPRAEQRSPGDALVSAEARQSWLRAIIRENTDAVQSFTGAGPGRAVAVVARLCVDAGFSDEECEQIKIALLGIEGGS